MPGLLHQADEAQTGSTILHDFPPPDLEARWRAFLTRVEFPSHYNAPEFFREPYWTGKRPFAILAWEQGEIVGVLTGIHEGDEVASGQQSRPQVCLAQSADPMTAGDTLARGLLSEAGRAKLISVYTWSWTPLEAFEPHGFRRRTLEGDVVLDLSQGPDRLFKQFPADRRTNIRYAMKHGVEVFQVSKMEDFADYYDIYLDWCRRKGPTPFSLEVEEAAFRLTQMNRRLFLASVSGKRVAGNIFRFYPGGLIEAARNNSLRESLRLHPNDLLLWRGIEWACNEGFRLFSFGGAHTFLRRFGGEVVPIYRYRLDRTWLRRRDLREAVLDKGRESLQRAPRPVENAVRRLLGRPPVKKETNPHGRGGK